MREAAAVAVVVLAPLAGLAWSLLVPLFRGSMAIEVANIAADPGRFITGTYCGVLMSFLMIPAAIVIGRLLRPSAPVATDIAMVLMATGACFHGCVLVFQLAETAVILGVPNQASATEIVSKLFEGTPFMVILFPFMAFYLGLAALSIIMIVRRIVPLWIPVVILAGIAVELGAPILWKARLFFAMLTVAFLGIALHVARSRKAELVRELKTV